jgi:glycerophosphoryl diester phosphodiesterase
MGSSVAMTSATRMTVRRPSRRVEEDRPVSDRSSSPAYFSPAPPRILAHRGLQVDAPENTMLAFSKAAALGITHLETDVHATRDGVAVISHDADLKRTAHRNERVDQLTLAELRSIDLGNGESFITLSELLEAFPHACFNIDIKSLAAAEPAATAILKAGAVGRVLITSFNDKRRRAATDRMPGVATSASAPSFILAFVLARLNLGRLAARVLSHVDAVQIPEKIAFLHTCTRRTVRIFHAAGLEIHVWTVNDPISMTRLFSHGVDGVFTDRADIAVKVLERLRKP